MVIARNPISIQLRLFAATLLILPLFLGVTAWILDRAFANYQLAGTMYVGCAPCRQW